MSAIHIERQAIRVLSRCAKDASGKSIQVLEIEGTEYRWLCFGRKPFFLYQAVIAGEDGEVQRNMTGYCDGRTMTAYLSGIVAGARSQTKGR